MSVESQDPSITLNSDPAVATEPLSDGVEYDDAPFGRVLSIADHTLRGVRVTAETASMIDGYLTEIGAVLEWTMLDMERVALESRRAEILNARTKKDVRGKVSEAEWSMIEEQILDLEYVIQAMQEGVMMSHEHFFNRPSRAEFIDIIKAYVETSPRFHPKLEFYNASDFQVDPRFRVSLECSDGALAYGIHVFEDGQLAVVIN